MIDLSATVRAEARARVINLLYPGEATRNAMWLRLR